MKTFLAQLAVGLLLAGAAVAGDAPVPPPTFGLDSVAPPTGRDPSMKGEPPPRGQAPALFRSELGRPDTLGVGRVADNVARALPAVETLCSWLGDKVAGLGYARVLPVIARDDAEMVDFLKRGIVGLVSETAISAIHFTKQAGATILLAEKRRGSTTYRSMVFVRAESPVRRIGDLAGRRVAFEDRGSTSAFLLPLAAIKSAGLATRALDQPSDPVPESTVGYFFTHSEDAIATAVSRRVADAGALSDEDWRSLRQRRPGATGELRVIHESRPVPRAFVLAGPAVSEQQRDGLRRILLSMDDDDAARDVLQRYHQVDGFDALTPDTRRQVEDLESTWELVWTEVD